MNTNVNPILPRKPIITVRHVEDLAEESAYDNLENEYLSELSNDDGESTFGDLQKLSEYNQIITSTDSVNDGVLGEESKENIISIPGEEPRENIIGTPVKTDSEELKQFVLNSAGSFYANYITKFNPNQLSDNPNIRVNAVNELIAFAKVLLNKLKG